MALFFAIAGWTLTALALLLALWALFADRARSRRRCPRCWYDLASTPGLKCPECGRAAKTERALSRTRRHWRWAAAAILLIILAQPVRLWPRIQQDGWRSTLPTSVVMHLLPIGGMDGPWGNEVMRRIGRAIGPQGQRTYMTLSRAERATMLRRAARGNLLARPIGEQWQASYGRFLKRHSNALYSRTRDGELLTPIQDGKSARTEEAGPLIRAALEEMSRIPPLVREVRTRDRWPVGTKPLVRVVIEHWWPFYYPDDMNIHWSANGGAQTGENAGRFEYELPVTLTGEISLDLQIDIRQIDRSSGSEAPRTVKTERHTLSYRTTETLEEAVGVVRSDAVDQLLTTLLDAKISRQSMALIDASALANHNLDDVAFGATAEILIDGDVAASFMCRWLGPAWGATHTGYSFGGAAQTDAALEAIKAGRATLRLRSDPAWALAVLDAERIWLGEVELPLGYQDGPVIRQFRTVPAPPTPPAPK